MVRVFLKGGVWKNSEDEILKAAVQKYGKQVRVSYTRGNETTNIPLFYTLMELFVHLFVMICFVFSNGLESLHC